MTSSADRYRQLLRHLQEEGGEITLAEVDAAVAEVRALAGDDEHAHRCEDALHRAVLRAVAEERVTGTEAAAMARVALTTLSIDFARWYA